MRKTAKTASIAIAATLLTMLSGTAMACGESLFRVGKGLTFREYTAPLPGNILIVAKTEGELAMAAAIQAAGHHVHVVDDATNISAAMAEHAADIVLSYADESDIVTPQLADFDATYLPVDRSGSARTSKLSADDSVKRFLKTIHRSLRDRQA